MGGLLNVYSEERPQRAAAPPSPLLAVPNYRLLRQKAAEYHIRTQKYLIQKLHFATQPTVRRLKPSEVTFSNIRPMSRFINAVFVSVPAM